MDYFVIPGDTIIEFPKVTGWIWEYRLGKTVLEVTYNDERCGLHEIILPELTAKKFILSWCAWRFPKDQYDNNEVTSWVYWVITSKAPVEVC